MQSEPSRKPSELGQEGRQELAACVATHWESVFGLLYRLSRNQHEAEDLAQETFLRAGQRWSSYVPGTNQRAWLLRIATNAFLDVRRRKQVAKMESMPQEADLAHVGRDVIGELRDKEMAAALDAALGEMAEVPRAIFLLRTSEGASFREIAEIIGMTEQTARWHMMQARRQLMKRLEGWKE